MTEQLTVPPAARSPRGRLGKSRLLRAYASHKGRRGATYRASALALAAHLGIEVGTASRAVLLALRDAARLRVELEDVLADQDAARARGRRREARITGRDALALRQELRQVEAHLAGLAPRPEPKPAPYVSPMDQILALGPAR